MKKLSVSFTLGLAMLLLLTFSCKKSDDKKEESFKCSTCITSPEALAANDASSKGMYKGVVIGSSGTIKFNVQNGGTTITAILVIDGTTATLTSSVSWVNGQPYVAPFTGTLNNQQVSITFSVQPDGSNPIITAANIPGHPNASFALVKETSNALLECFEGTYSTTKPENGTFNIMLSRTLGKLGGISRKDGSNTPTDVKGTIVNGIIKDERGKEIGTLKEDLVTGSFQDGSGITVTFTGKRTL